MGSEESEAGTPFRKYLFYSNRPSSKTTEDRLSETGSPVYVATYTIDAFRRRWNPFGHKNKNAKRLLFFGCSMTFGEGLNDDQTIPAQVSLLAKNIETYNYGTSAYGPGHIWAYLRHVDVAKQFKKTEDTSLIYLWGDWMFSRAVGSLIHLSWGAGSTPYLFLSNGRLDFGGNWESQFPLLTALSKALYSLPILGPYILRRNIDWPRIGHYSAADLLLVKTILAETFAAYRERFHSNSQYLVFLPHSKYSARVLSAPLKQLGVSTIDLSHSADGMKDDQLYIAGDGHFSASGARLVAQELVKSLELAQ